MPRIVDHEARKSEILSQCFELFAEHGYSALTMRKIAQSLNVSTGLLYHYFDGKFSIFASMFDWIGERDMQAAAEAIPKSLALPERVKLLQAFLLNRSSFLLRVFMVAIDFQRHTTPEESGPIIKGIIDSYHQSIRVQLELDEDSDVKAVFSYILGSLVHHYLNQEAVNLEEQFAVLELIKIFPQLKKELNS